MKKKERGGGKREGERASDGFKGLNGDGEWERGRKGGGRGYKWGGRGSKMKVGPNES